MGMAFRTVAERLQSAWNFSDEQYEGFIGIQRQAPQ